MRRTSGLNSPQLSRKNPAIRLSSTRTVHKHEVIACLCADKTVPRFWWHRSKYSTFLKRSPPNHRCVAHPKSIPTCTGEILLRDACTKARLARPTFRPLQYSHISSWDSGRCGSVISRRSPVCAWASGALGSSSESLTLSTPVWSALDAGATCQSHLLSTSCHLPRRFRPCRSGHLHPHLPWATVVLRGDSVVSVVRNSPSHAVLQEL